MDGDYVTLEVSTKNNNPNTLQIHASKSLLNPFFL